jgi:twinkle protein
MNDFKDLTTQSSSNMLAEIQDLNSFAITSRGISKQVIDYFGIKMSINPDGSGGSHYYPYTKDGKVTAYKERVLPKSFQIHGDYRDTELFGQSSASGGKTLVITEGELDACAVAQSFLDKYNRIFPAVSIPSATGLRVLLEQRDWIRTFESIILLFDNDEAGKAAIEKYATAYKINGCSLSICKDISDAMEKYGFDKVHSELKPLIKRTLNI